MENKFYKLELSGDSKSQQAKEMYFACVDKDGKVLALMNKPALEFTDDRYLKKARLNVDMAYDKGKKEGLDGVKSWMLTDKEKSDVGNIETTEISSQDWIKARAQLHKGEKIALVCQMEKKLNQARIKPRAYENVDDLTIKELRLARAELLTQVANKNEFPEYKITEDEVRTAITHNILKEKFSR